MPFSSWRQPDHETQPAWRLSSPNHTNSNADNCPGLRGEISLQPLQTSPTHDHGTGPAVFLIGDQMPKNQGVQARDKAFILVEKLCAS